MLLILLSSPSLWAVGCDCDVKVFSPLTGSHQLAPATLNTYELEEFASYSVKSQLFCRKLCEERFMEDLPTERLTALLLTYSNRLINEKVLGFNCTGLTTLKYPVRVKARLGRMDLGYVVNMIQVVNHEEACF